MIVQTRMKDNPAISFAAKGDVEAFFDQELAIRKETDFPPFSRMVNIVVHSSNASAARSFADMLAQKLRSVVRRTKVYGANECPIEKIREKYRFQILLRSSYPADMLNSIAKVTSDLKVPRNVAFDIDVDPVDLM